MSEPRRYSRAEALDLADALRVELARVLESFEDPILRVTFVRFPASSELAVLLACDGDHASRTVPASADDPLSGSNEVSVRFLPPRRQT